jgi:hypothetical protein
MIMKKGLLVTAIAISLYACNDSGTTAGVESDSSTNAATSPTVYSPEEGDVSYRNGKLMVWKNNEWVAADNDVTLDNGVVVRSDGHAEKDHTVIVLDDGEVISKSGHFFDKAGNALEDAWDATKKGAKEAGQAVKKGANKVGEEVKDVLKTDKDKKDKD